MTAGDEINGQVVNHNEKVISIDGLLIASHLVYNLDEAMNHYDARSIYSKEAGIALATQMDKNVLQEGVLGARSATLVTTVTGGVLRRPVQSMPGPAAWLTRMAMFT